jgi:hypothetical protein
VDQHHESFLTSHLLRFCLNVRLGLWKAGNFLPFFPLAALFQKLDPLEPLQHITPGGDGAGSFEAAMLRHGYVKKVKRYKVGK